MVKQTILWMLVLITTAGCAGNSLERPGNYLQDYEARPVETTGTVAVPEPPERLPIDGRACFGRQGVDTWFTIRKVAEAHKTIAEENAGMAAATARERNKLLAAGRSAERQAQDLYSELQRCERRRRWASGSWWLWLGIGVLIGSQ